ncbi:MAG TPA: mechanosensitive ion channel domain-containing protein [Verrucomicrobiae bacterium]|nr:mechanosensitive ion channel domain-containing protein [Verrucomicrobiae bacterium]
MTNSIATNAPPELATSATNWWDIHVDWAHVAVIIVLAFFAHVIVKSIRYFSEWLIVKSHEKKHPFEFVTQQPKFITLTRLIVSAVTFAIYAAAILLVLLVIFRTRTEKVYQTYLTGAAVVGLVLSFGLQGLVQDVVTCVTLILSDAMDVGDIVDLMNGVIGRVERIGLRFTKVTNFYNQEIFVPNRNIANVSRFPHDGIIAYADVQIPAAADQQKAVRTIQNVARGMWAQFGAIILSEPVFSEVETTPGNWNFLRIQFKIWPGQNGLIETNFRSQIVSAMKTFDPAYADWQVVVAYRAMGGKAA